MCSSVKAISEEMSPIDYPQTAVGPDLDIISLFTSASAAPASQSRNNDVQELKLPGHGCVQMWSVVSSTVVESNKCWYRRRQNTGGADV